jgi:hypothetical protein
MRGYETPERSLVPFSPIRKILHAELAEVQEARPATKTMPLPTPLFLWAILAAR